MPSNRRTQPTAEKRAELIHAARTLFVQAGFDATPMNRIARQAGVTPNTIYWYFKDKDELLLAVLDQLLHEYLADYLRVAQAPLAEQLFWLVERLRPVSSLMATVHARIRLSPALDDWHDRLHMLMEQILLAQLPVPLPEAGRAAEISIVSYTIEGLVSHPIDAGLSRQTCEALARRLLPAPAP